MSKVKKGICRHCKRGPITLAAKKLCGKCNLNPSIKNRYPYIRDTRAAKYNEPTMEELDKMIAKQLPTMPGKAEYHRVPSTPRIVEMMLRRRDRRHNGGPL